ncbi:uncharacterized protein FOMMEDRAFT_155664 [Fomitiporia mediterranea MF3/22]|uniref:uncharacterized protein n=1 Tax=Fomitiporia mediterranea (strain MF3/22) TaxID=694068 RepID=UPI0004408E07|nr:uncharacterized protein FOMMEDRAFT_155664 [Fomitiporia mediterranea MF3/22]EJD04519.1 hypothetical protein FOMMEDRAFT_155664 [Fomitiporia mediterranea MF3/22]
MHINQLPVEILRIIFLNALPARDEMLKGEIRPIYSISTPLYISHVCRHWSRVSLAYGDLWSHLFIKYSSHEENNWSAKAPEIFTEWLERTRGGLLNFTIHCYLKDGEGSEHRAFQSIITKLLSKQKQWRDVDFSWRCIKVYSDFQGIHASKMSKLVSLSLSHEIIKQDETTVISHINVSSSPKLAFLTLWGSCNLFFDPVHALDLPFLRWLSYCGKQEGDHNGRLIFTSFIQNVLPPSTVLEVTGFVAHEDTLVPALRLLTALEELRISFYWGLTSELFRVLTPDHHNGQESNVIICPSLRKLYLINVNDLYVPDVPEVQFQFQSMAETETEGETEYEELTEIMDENGSESEYVEPWDEVQNEEMAEQQRAARAEFFGALCTMAERRHNLLNTQVTYGSTMMMNQDGCT